MLSLCLSATLQITLNQGLILVLRKALAPLTKIADEAIFKYSSEGIELMAMNTDSIIGVLKFRSLDFQHFVCDTEGIGWVDVHLLYKTLSFVDDEEYCSVIINYGRYDQIGFPGLQFVFKNCRTLKERYRRIELTEVDPEGFLPDESKTEYDLVAAIPSEEFRCILKHLSFFGPEVFIAITDKQVKFSASNAEIVLKKELSECIIGGSAGDLPELNFEIEHIIPLMNASLLSNWVWILFSHDSFTLLQLNFPVGALGTLEERYRGIELTESDPEQVLPDESETEYDLVAAIPSEEFRCILKYLFFYGHQVFVAISDKQVKFSALNAEIVLKKELSECIIGGFAHGDLPVQLNFEMEHIRPLMNASLLSNMVWILHFDDSISFLQFNFPVRTMGNIMFFFT